MSEGIGQISNATNVRINQERDTRQEQQKLQVRQRQIEDGDRKSMGALKWAATLGSIALIGGGIVYGVKTGKFSKIVDELKDKAGKGTQKAANEVTQEVTEKASEKVTTKAANEVAQETTEKTSNAVKIPNALQDDLDKIAENKDKISEINKKADYVNSLKKEQAELQQQVDQFESFTGPLSSQQVKKYNKTKGHLANKNGELKQAQADLNKLTGSSSPKDCIAELNNNTSVLQKELSDNIKTNPEYAGQNAVRKALKRNPSLSEKDQQRIYDNAAGAVSGKTNDKMYNQYLATVKKAEAKGYNPANIPDYETWLAKKTK